MEIRKNDMIIYHTKYLRTVVHSHKKSLWGTSPFEEITSSKWNQRDTFVSDAKTGYIPESCLCQIPRLLLFSSKGLAVIGQVRQR